MSEPDRCPRCAAALPAGAPGGLCPLCLLREGLALGPPTDGPTPLHGADTTRATTVAGRSSVADSLGVASRVALTADQTDPAPITLPASPEVPAREAERYQILGEIARGGMGAVLRGRDPDLGRELAVKVLLSAHRDRPAMVRRFVEEAQISGQLQHPGVVPVYELGVFNDRRPYFTMKLVRGRTLAAMLDGRAGSSDDLPRFLAVFEQVCQTVAYAHDRKVIHRDLKPSNVMVGSFGEVQVMDWGLAKVLAPGGASEGSDPWPEVRTDRGGPDGASRAGAVIGTPAYMAPEQARGEVDRLDERADVFALGAILCEVLTGRPPFAGRSREEATRQAAAGDLAEASARLSAGGADPELVALARRCLAADPPSRPRDAGEVARAVTAYLAGVQERLRAAELARVEAQARAEGERKRRRAQLRYSGALVAIFALGVLGVASQWRRAERHLADARNANALLTEAQKRAASARDQALARLGLAIEAVETFTTGASEDLLLKEPQHAKLRAGLLNSALAYYRKLQKVMEADPDGSPAELAAALGRVAKLSFEVGSKQDALTALGQVVAIRERLAREHPGDRDGRLALSRARIDLGEYLSALSRPAEAEALLTRCVADCEALVAERGDDPEALKHLAVAESTRGHASRQLGRAAEALARDERAAGLFARLYRARPEDRQLRRFLAFELAKIADLDVEAGRFRAGLARWQEAGRHFEALAEAAPARPGARRDLAYFRRHLAQTLDDLGKVDEARRLAGLAKADFAALVRESPNNSDLRLQLAYCHLLAARLLNGSDRAGEALGEVTAARAILEPMGRDQPDDTAIQYALGSALVKNGSLLRALRRFDEAVAVIREATAVHRRMSDRNPGDRQFRSAANTDIATQAATFLEAGRPDDALREYRRVAAAYEAEPDLFPDDRYNLGCAHARIAALTGAGRPGAGPEPRRHADLAVAALREAMASGFQNAGAFRNDPDLDPLRGRADFRELLLDLAFPDDPFAPAP